MYCHPRTPFSSTPIFSKWRTPQKRGYMGGIIRAGMPLRKKNGGGGKGSTRVALHLGAS